MENNLPESWELVKLVEQINFLPTGVKEYSGTRKYYSTGSIQENVNTPEGEFTFKNRPSRANRISVKGDVFQARMKATDKGILVDDKLHDQLFSTGFIQLRPYGNTYDNKLLYYLIKSEQFLTQKNEYATGSTQEALTDTGASEIEIPLPPLAEQQRIVAKLDALFEKIESNKKRLDKIPVILKRFRQSVLAAAVSGRLTEDWKNKNNLEEWAEKRLGDLIDVVGGFAYKSTSFKKEGNNQVFRIGNIKPYDLYFDYSPVYIDDAIAINTERYEAKELDILISMTGTKYKRDYGYAGMLLKTPKRVFVNQRVSRIRAKGIEPKFLLHWLQSDEFRNHFFEGETGNVNQGNVGMDGIKEARIQLPSPIEQNEVSRIVEQLFAFADKLEARYNKAKAMLDKVPQSILAKAFRGELVSQNPDDEPASVLLGRIKEEKEKLKPVKKNKQK